jgi:hypothetical protein
MPLSIRATTITAWQTSRIRDHASRLIVGHLRDLLEGLSRRQELREVDSRVELLQRDVGLHSADLCCIWEMCKPFFVFYCALQHAMESDSRAGPTFKEHVQAR